MNIHWGIAKDQVAQRAHSRLKTESKVLKSICKNCNASLRKSAKSCSTNTSMVQRVMKRNGLRYNKKKKVHKQTPEQFKRAKYRARKLYNKMLFENTDCIPMDYESYVKMDGTTMLEPQLFIAKNGDILPTNVTQIAVKKFEDKVLIWQAICTCGKKYSIFYTKGTINKDIHIEECLKKRLLPLYRQHTYKPLFWPDLVPAHYATLTVDFMEKNKIEFLSKWINPPNVPQLRPNERYWALTKSKFRENPKPVKDMTKFKKKWSLASRKIGKIFVQSLMRGVRPKIRLYVRNQLKM